MNSVATLSEADELRLYFDGVDLFNAHQFFEAHEVWEDIWRASTGVKREFFQGLIQIAVAVVHLRRGNARGVINLHRTYQKHFAVVPENFMGLNLGELMQAMNVALHPALGGGASLFDRNLLDLNLMPKLSPTIKRLRIIGPPNSCGSIESQLIPNR